MSCCTLFTYVLVLTELLVIKSRRSVLFRFTKSQLVGHKESKKFIGCDLETEYEKRTQSIKMKNRGRKLSTIMIPLQKDINFYFRFNSTSLPFEGLFRSKVRIENISNTYTILCGFICQSVGV